MTFERLVGEKHAYIQCFVDFVRTISNDIHFQSTFAGDHSPTFCQIEKKIKSKIPLVTGKLRLMTMFGIMSKVE